MLNEINDLPTLLVMIGVGLVLILGAAIVVIGETQRHQYKTPAYYLWGAGIAIALFGFLYPFEGVMTGIMLIIFGAVPVVASMPLKRTG